MPSQAQTPIMGDVVANAPVYVEGDHRIFSINQFDWPDSLTSRPDGIFDIIYTKGEFQVWRLDGDKRIAPWNEPQRLEILRSVGLLQNARWFIDWPISLGKKWEGKFQLTRPTGSGTGTVTINTVTRVVDVKEEKTEAGIFENVIVMERHEFGPGVNLFCSFSYSAVTKSFPKVSKKSNLSNGRSEVELIYFATEK